MLLISTKERPRESRRDQPLRGGRCAHLADDGRRLADHDCIAADRYPSWLAAACVGPGSIRFCRLYRRSIAVGPRCRAEWTMTVTEVTSKRDGAVDDQNASFRKS